MKAAIIITGASRGIGRAVAKRFLSEVNDFDSMVLIARPSKAFEATLCELRAMESSKNIIKIEADLSEISEIDRIYTILAGLKVNVTGIVNNAGYTNPLMIDDIEVDDFEKTLRTNLIAPFRMVQLALRLGHSLKTVLNVASTAGMSGRAGWLTYSASKAALINMSEVMADELGQYNINVISISPGRCATNLRKTLAPDENPDTIMQPDHVAETITMLFSSTGRMLESQNLVVRTKTQPDIHTSVKEALEVTEKQNIAN